MNQIPGERIEYIDALRGFTMILVVFSHVIFFSYDAGSTLNSFNKAFITFRMPLFFFVSGFVLYKPTRIWSKDIKGFLISKAKIQLIPTLFFLLIYDMVFNYRIYRSFIDPNKYGYWFTLTLFEFFVIYSVAMLVIEKVKKKWVERIIWTAIIIVTLFFPNISNDYLYTVPKEVFGVLGTVMLRYFCFFFAGTMVRKHPDSFVKITNNGYVMGVVVLVFFAGVLFLNKINISDDIPFNSFWIQLRFLLIGVTGVTIVFTFFRKNAKIFSNDTKIGRGLQYAGKRTLDIYLIHYFLLPRHLDMVGEFFKNNVNPTIEFLVTGLIAIWIVLLCLLISNIIRLSNTLGHYLFGVKLNKEG